MQGSNLPLSKWALAIYLMSTSLKGVSSMKLRRDLGAYHHISVKHLDRYAAEFEGRHNARSADTIDQIQGVTAGWKPSDSGIRI